MRLSRIAVLSLALLAFAGCTSDLDTLPDHDTPVPSRIIRQALSAMSEMDSYHISLRAVPAVGPSYESGEWEIDFVAPSTYRIISRVIDREEVGCEVSDDWDELQGCRPLYGPPSGSRVGEIVTDEVESFARECLKLETSCADWHPGVSVLDVPIVAGPAWVPWVQSLLLTIELSRDFQIISADDAAVHLRGHVNPALVLNETGARIFGGEYEHWNTDYQAYYETNPIQVDMFVSLPNYTIQEFRLSGQFLPQNGDYLDGQPVFDEIPLSVDVTYSRFDEVTIDKPEVPAGADG